MRMLEITCFRQRGGIKPLLLVLLAVAVLVAAWLVIDEDAGKDIRKQAELKTLDVIGDAATKRLGAGGQGDKIR